MRVRDLLQAVAHRAGYHVSRWPMKAAGHDFKVILQDFLKAHRINCVLDVGANEGQYGKMLRSLGYEGRIVSFEPQVAAFEWLQASAATDREWIVFNLALGDRTGSFPLNVMATSTLSSFKSPNATGKGIFGPWIQVTSTQMVQVRRLDEMLDRCVQGLTQPSMLLKIDTQGYDQEVLHGAGGQLAAFCGIQTEVAVRPIYNQVPGFPDSISAITALGFEISALTPVFRHLFTVVEFDCLFQNHDSRREFEGQEDRLAVELVDPDGAGIVLNSHGTG